MCLSKLGKFKPNKFGYKWTLKVGQEYYSPNDASYNYKEKIWNKAKPHRHSDTYGFHIFNKLEEAKKSAWRLFTESNGKNGTPTLLRVVYKNFLTGYGDGLSYSLPVAETIVAKQMKIIEEVKI